MFVIFAWVALGCSGISVTPSRLPNILAVSGPCFEGIVLTATYIMPQPRDTVITRFTPSQQDIAGAERIIHDSISKINRDRVNQSGDNPVLDGNLCKYFRQYVGFVDQNGDKILFINMLWNRWSLAERFRGWADPREGLKDGYVQVFDGGSRYWQIKINLTRGCVVDFWVNGDA